uniref:Uncharacterized protein n=1 Tax=Strigops habroptila TaxID=2489341 RepID=A0A672U7J0_STRHB
MYQCPCPVISIIYCEQIANFTYPTDWIDCRYEGLIVTSDSSDEELPFLLEAPAEQQREEEDDDVVILEEDENMNFALPQSRSSELNGPGFELTSNQEPGPSLLPPVTTNPQPVVNQEIISLENSDLPPQQGEKVEAQQGEDLEVEQNLREPADAGPADQETHENSQLDHPYVQPLEGEPHAVVNSCAPQQGQPEADPGSLRAYGEKAPGPAFPRPEPQQDGIPGPASPQPAHPPEETGPQAAVDNEQPGPAFPAQGCQELGSSNVPEQGAAGQDQDLTAQLIRETVSIPRACLPSVKGIP